MAASAVFLEKPETQIEDLLERICNKLQISPTQHDSAEQRYHAIGDWLAADGSALKALEPQIYPQGSIRIGTSVKPMGSQEYDLDLVCQFEANPLAFSDPTILLHAVEHRLREHDTYRAMVAPLKNRCVRVTYANEFHLDILPACPDRYAGGTCVVVPDRKAQNWKASNPKGFAKWFLRICESRATKFLEKAEPVPALEASDEKAPLKLVVQLLKRARDVAFAGDCDSAPPSIVLTTLAALHYNGEDSTGEALSNILQRIVDSIPSDRRLVVINPMNPQEDFSERWGDHRLYMAFVHFISSLQRSWQSLRLTRGMANVALQIQRLFGEQLAKSVIKEQAESVTKMRDNGSLGLRRGSGILSGLTPAAIPVPKNVFYGGEE